MLLDTLSIVCPVYRNADSLPELVERLVVVLPQIAKEFEIILVDDGNRDGSWAMISGLQQHDARVKGIRLSRNFGQHLAISAGINAASGEWLVVMDGDLQDVPEEIPKLSVKALEGFDVVMASRTERTDGYFKRASSHLFYALFSYLTGRKIDPTIGNFGILHRRVVTALQSMHETFRWFPGMVHWVGFDATTTEVRHGARQTGASAYSITQLLHLGIDIICMFSDKPLRLSVKAGFVIAFLSFVVGATIGVRRLVGTSAPPLGWASIVVSLWFLSGLLMFNMGVIGLYIARIFNEVRDRPPYIVHTRVGF